MSLKITHWGEPLTEYGKSLEIHWNGVDIFPEDEEWLKDNQIEISVSSKVDKEYQRVVPPLYFLCGDSPVKSYDDGEYIHCTVRTTELDAAAFKELREKLQHYLAWNEEEKEDD